MWRRAAGLLQQEPEAILFALAAAFAELVGFSAAFWLLTVIEDDATSAFAPFCIAGGLLVLCHYGAGLLGCAAIGVVVDSLRGREATVGSGLEAMTACAAGLAQWMSAWTLALERDPRLRWVLPLMIAEKLDFQAALRRIGELNLPGRPPEPRWSPIEGEHVFPIAGAGPIVTGIVLVAASATRPETILVVPFVPILALMTLYGMVGGMLELISASAEYVETAGRSRRTAEAA